MALSRRDFLGALAATAALPSFARVTAGTQAGDPATRFFSDEASARKIGALYLATVVPRENAAVLRVLIAPPDEDAEEWFATVKSAAFRKHIRKSVRDDFAIGNTVVLSGWVLADTEARLAALVSLS